jgi:hypothetical protein
VTKLNTTDDLLKLEKVVRKVIVKAFKDRTLDYTVQFSVSSLEPKKVKYAFMINGTKQEVRVEPQAFDSFNEALSVAEGMLKEIDTVELEKTFHVSRINTYNSAISQHEARIKQLDNPVEEDSNIPMEEV